MDVDLTVSLFIWTVMRKQKKPPQNVMVVSGNERGYLREHAMWHAPSFVIELTASLYIFPYEFISQETLYAMWVS